MKMLTLASLLSVSTLTFMPAIASASPIGVRVDITCPSTSEAPNILTNFGDYIAGQGQETIAGQTNVIYFESTSPLDPAVPTQLIDYRNQATDFDSTKGIVYCSYVSSGHAEQPPFTVSYTLKNAQGGAILQSAANNISLSLPIGLQK